jgi:DNA end-binding protein Ku
MAPKRTGSAVIVLGLERVPVAVYPATSESPRISFTSICQEHGSKVEQLQRCTVDQHVFEKGAKGEKPEGLTKAYELRKGPFLSLSEEEIEEVQPQPAPEIVIAAALELEDVKPLLWTGQAQYLGVDAGAGPVVDVAAERSFSQFLDALVEASAGDGLVAVGRWSTRGADKLVGIYRKDDRLVLQGLRRAGEVRDITELEVVEQGDWGGLAKMTAILQRLKVEELGSYPDERYDATVKLLQAKAAKIAEAPRKVPKRARATR